MATPNSAKKPEAGDVLPDGWIYLGISPETGEGYSLEPAAVAIPGLVSQLKGEEHASRLKKQGHKDARLPTDTELNDIFNKIVKSGRNDAAKLVTRAFDYASEHWSSTPGPSSQGNARLQSFHDGSRLHQCKAIHAASVRCVRSEPRP